VAAAALEGIATGEDERAAELAGRRARRLENLPAERAYPRLVSFLLRRGYPPGTAREAARAALGVEAGGE
jgi:SOS response regulatory protein OraA/RecX